MDALLNYRVLFYNFYLTKIVIIFDAHTPIFTIFLFTSKKKENVTQHEKTFPFLCSSSFFIHSFHFYTRRKQLIDDTRKKKKDGN